MYNAFQRRFVISLFFISALLYASQSLAANPTVIQPNGGETINAGDTYNIQWSASVDSVKYNIMYSPDNGATWLQVNCTACHVSRGKITTTSHDWNVPKPISNKTKYLVKIVGYNSANVKVGADVSEAPFTISVLNVTAPNGGETVAAGSITDITWSTDTLVPVSYAQLSYTIDGGLTWKPIKKIAGNPGTYKWTTPKLPATVHCKVKVELLKADNNIAVAAVDTSNANFIILVTSKTNASFEGEYFASGVGISLPADGVKTHLGNFASTGDGNANVSDIVTSETPKSEAITYGISSNGKAYFGQDHGMLSTSNNIFLFTDTNKSDNFLDFGFGIKASIGLDESALNGAYLVGVIRSDGTTKLGEETFDGNGNATFHCISFSGGVCDSDQPFTYSVNADGTFIDSNGRNGVVSSDGQLYTMVDANPGHTLVLRVGMKKSSGLSDATLAGKFYGASIGVTPSGVYTSFHKFSLNGAGSFVITDLFDSNVGLETHSGTYTINSDGTFDTGEHKGMALESGQGFFVVDTNASDSKNEVSISVGLKATK